MISSVSSPTYDQERRDRLMALAPQVAMATADVYAGSTPFFPTHSGFPVVDGVLAAGHVVYGLVKAGNANGDYTIDRKAMGQGVGHLITGAGFAGLAAGVGAWALPLIFIGEATRLAATMI